MTNNSKDFQDRVRNMSAYANNTAIRECYGVSNCAKFVTGGFLGGIPNLDSLDDTIDALCVFSKIQLSPNSELHTAILIGSNLRALLTRLNKMASTTGDFFADRNNNCALLVGQNGIIYVYNKAKNTFELTQEIIQRIGPGIEPDAFYWAVYGDQADVEDGQVKQLEKLVGPTKFLKVEVRQNLNAVASYSTITSLDSMQREFLSACKSAKFETTSSSINRFAISLLSKRLLILTGLSGSGKTKLAQAFARWLCPSPECYRLIPVGADWTSNENILGYPNGLHPTAYITKPALDLILHALAHENDPHFLILDEMNLSHVERYFADILSAIESEEPLPLHPDGERSANGTSIPTHITLPKNLFIIGTVNVDETTYMFSPKVLDRANVIEFRMAADDLSAFLTNPGKPDLTQLDGKGAGFGSAFVAAAAGPAPVPADVKDDFEREMLLFFQAMQPYGAEFGYRVAHEAARFVHFYKLLGNHSDDDIWFPSAFDCVVVQKFLPKLHGSRARLGPLLKSLWFLCVSDAAARGADAVQSAQEASRATERKSEPSREIPAGAPYPLSAEKIARMWRLLGENGFASFAEA